MREELFKLGEAEDKAAEDFDKATNARILKRTEELLAADGLTQAEESLLIDRAVAMGVLTEEAGVHAQGVIDEAWRTAAEINAATGTIIRDVETNWRMNIQSTTQPIVTLTSGGLESPRVFEDTTFQQGSGSKKSRGGRGFASGISDFIVPPGFQNDTFQMGVSTGERVNVDTAGQRGNGGDQNEQIIALLQEIADKVGLDEGVLSRSLTDASLKDAQ